LKKIKRQETTDGWRVTKGKRFMKAITGGNVPGIGTVKAVTDIHGRGERYGYIGLRG
jgi:hypothetical protein